MKGQNLRFGIKQSGAVKYIAAALFFDLDIQVDTEETSNKDITGGYKAYEAGLIGWSGSGQVNYVNDAEDTAAMQADDMFALLGQKLEVVFDMTKGEKNRTLDAGKYTSKAILTGWKISAENGTKINYDFTFQGTEALTKVEA